MNHERSSLTSGEQQAFELLVGSLEQELSQRAVNSWQVPPRPNPLDEFDTTAQTRADGKRYIPPGHVALKGDFGQTNS